MFGVGQTVAGIFLISCGGPITAGAGAGLVITGVGFMFSGLNSAFRDYERAALDLKVIEEKAKRLTEEK